MFTSEKTITVRIPIDKQRKINLCKRKDSLETLCSPFVYFHLPITYTPSVTTFKKEVKGFLFILKREPIWLIVSENKLP